VGRSPTLQIHISQRLSVVLGLFTVFSVPSVAEFFEVFGWNFGAGDKFVVKSIDLAL
jgi:hypothetical protein